jgi:hypothetical protein
MKRSNKIVLAALAVLTAAAPLSAMAAPPKKTHAPKFGMHEQTATGAITSVNAQEVKLANGDTFKLAPGVQATSYKAGDKVNVQYTMKDGARTADRITAAKN